MKRIVITGATSFIGTHLINEWLKHDCEIFAIIRPASQNADRIPLNDRVHIIACNMDSYHLLNQALDTADYFYHLAWDGARVPHRDNLALQIKNYECALKAMEAAQKMKCSFFLGAGSQAEYGLTNGIVDEDYPCNPNTAYGQEKLHAYNELSHIAQATEMRFIWTRIFSIYGKYDYSGSLVMSSLQKMKNNETVKMTAGTQMWDYLHVEDVARAMVLFAEVDCANGIYNIASGEYKPLKEFVKIMKEVTGSRSELEFGAIPYGPNGPVNLCPDIDKLKRALNWEPEIDFRTGIKRMDI